VEAVLAIPNVARNNSGLVSRTISFFHRMLDCVGIRALEQVRASGASGASEGGDFCTTFPTLEVRDDHPSVFIQALRVTVAELRP